jgi:hypothetical protein
MFESQTIELMDVLNCSENLMVDLTNVSFRELTDIDPPS